MGLTRLPGGFTGLLGRSENVLRGPFVEKQAGDGRAIVALTLEQVEEVLGLPEGVRLTAVHADGVRRVVEFRLDGPGLPPCDEGAEPRCFDSLRAAGEWQREA